MNRDVQEVFEVSGGQLAVLHIIEAEKRIKNYRRQVNAVIAVFHVHRVNMFTFFF